MIVRSRIVAVAVLLALAGACASSASAATDGDLDPAFNAGGMRVDQFTLAGSLGSFVNDVVVRPDGTPLAAVFAQDTDGKTKFTTVGYTAAGALDTGFAGSGVLRNNAAPVATDESFSNALALLSGGGVLETGSAGPDTHEKPALELSTPGGTLDTTFGPPPGGIFLPAFAPPGPPASAEGAIDAVVATADGGAFVAGGVDASGGQTGLVAKIRPDGSLDTAFDVTGAHYTDFDRSLGGHRNSWQAIALAPGGKVVVAGETNDVAPGGLVTAVARFNADGTPDATFGPGGLRYIQSTALTSSARKTLPDGLAVLPDGRVVVGLTVAYANLSASPDDDVFQMGAARLQADGAPDPSFGTGGIATLQAGDAPGGGFRDSSVRDIALQPDGKVILGGSASDTASGAVQLALARLTTTGAADASFGAGGSERIPVVAGSAGSQAIALALTPAMSLYVGGSVGGSPLRSFMGRVVADRPPAAAITGPAGDVTAGFPAAFSASGSADPEGGPLSFAWDLNNDGSFGDATGSTAGTSYGPGSHTVTVRVSDANGLSATASLTINVVAAPGKKAAPKPALPRVASASKTSALVRISCPGGASCAGTITLYAIPKPKHGARRAVSFRVVYGRAAFRLPGGRSKLVTVKLTRAGRRAIRAHRTLRVTARAVSSAAGQRSSQTVATITLRRHR